MRADATASQPRTEGGPDGLTVGRGGGGGGGRKGGGWAHKKKGGVRY